MCRDSELGRPVSVNQTEGSQGGRGRESRAENELEKGQVLGVDRAGVVDKARVESQSTRGAPGVPGQHGTWVLTIRFSLLQ